MRELADLWHYRANLSQEVKREICPPHGNPFTGININSFQNRLIIWFEIIINKIRLKF